MQDREGSISYFQAESVINLSLRLDLVGLPYAGQTLARCLAPVAHISQFPTGIIETRIAFFDWASR